MSNSEEKLSNAFNVLYGTLKKEWYEFLEDGYENQCYCLFKKELRWHSRSVRRLLRPLIYGRKKYRVRTSLFGQVFYLKKNKGIEKRIIETIEHIFGIFFSVYWAYPPAKFNKELNWEYLTESEFTGSFINFEEKLNEKWNSLEKEVKGRTYSEEEEVYYEDGDNEEEEKINEEYEKSIDILYEKFCDHFLKIKEEKAANSDDPRDEVVLIEFKSNYLTRDGFKEYIEDVDNKLRSQWTAMAHFNRTPPDSDGYKKALEDYKVTLQMIEDCQFRMSARDTIYRDDEYSEDSMEELFNKISMWKNEQ